MRKAINLLVLIVVVNLLVIGCLGTVKAAETGNTAKKNLTVLKFSGEMSSGYRKNISDRILADLIESNRFNVIDRQNLDSILDEQKFSTSGLVNPNQGSKIGKIAGLEKVIVGKVTSYNYKYHEAEYHDGTKIQDAYYDVKISATVKMVDVETAKYNMAVTAEASGADGNKTRALDQAIENLSANISQSLTDQFKIKANVTNVEQQVILTIDQGSNRGIKKSMNFNIYDGQGLARNKVAHARVFKVDNNQAKLRAYGDFEKIMSGYYAVENKKEQSLEAVIIKRNWGSVTLNMGQNMGIRKGQIYEVKDKSSQTLVDPKTGRVLGTEQKDKGLIYITEAYDNYAQGKIIEGNMFVRKGMAVKKSNQSAKNSSIELFVAQQPFSISSNYYQGDKYRTSDPRDVTGTGLGATYSNYSYGSNLNQSFSVILMNIPLDEEIESNGSSADSLNVFNFEGTIDYYLPLLPSRLYVYPGVGLGIAYMSQETHYDARYDEVSGLSFMPLVKCGVDLKVGRFNIFGELNYRFAAIDSWTYNTEGDSSPDADNSLVPYPNIDYKSGPTIKAGVGFKFDNLGF